MSKDTVRQLLEPFFGRVMQRDTLGAAERAAIAAAADAVIDFSPGEDLVLEGQRPSRSMLVALPAGTGCWQTGTANSPLST